MTKQIIVSTTHNQLKKTERKKKRQLKEFHFFLTLFCENTRMTPGDRVGGTGDDGATLVNSAAKKYATVDQ